MLQLSFAPPKSDLFFLVGKFFCHGIVEIVTAKKMIARTISQGPSQVVIGNINVVT